MKIFKLTEEDVLKAIDTGEDGMGYQIARLEVRLGYGGQTPTSGILLNRQYFTTLDEAPLLGGGAIRLGRILKIQRWQQ